MTFPDQSTEELPWQIYAGEIDFVPFPFSSLHNGLCYQSSHVHPYYPSVYLSTFCLSITSLFSLHNCLPSHNCLHLSLPFEYYLLVNFISHTPHVPFPFSSLHNSLYHQPNHLSTPPPSAWVSLPFLPSQLSLPIYPFHISMYLPHFLLFFCRTWRPSVQWVESRWRSR